MKKMLILLVCFLFVTFFVNINFQNKLCYANFIAEYENNQFELDISTKDTNIQIRKNVYNLPLFKKYEIVEKILKMGFDLKEAVDYVFPNFKNSVRNIENNINKEAINASVYSLKNCKIGFIDGKNGLKVNEKDLYKQFYESLKTSENVKIITTIIPFDISIDEIKNKFYVAGKFSTDFSSSGLERKNNIKTALSAIDGIIIKNGETFSFNSVTGARKEENGYKTAKIIVNGQYVEGVGGGVCQVSTTLYNAALLSNLDVLEVHSHSLPSHYVEPCFDAMVNYNSSDLKIQNNTGSDCIITTSAVDDKCQVVIYGTKPQYKIVRRSEIYEDVPPNILYKRSDDEKNIISRKGVKGYKAKAYLDYYRENKLIKTQKIRDDVYLPIDEIIVI